MEDKTSMFPIGSGGRLQTCDRGGRADFKFALRVAASWKVGFLTG